MSARVVAVSRRRGHHFSKTPSLEICLVAGLGVEGDRHFGDKTQHRSRARFNPDRFRQGMMAARLGRTATGAPMRKAGVMGVVIASGQVVAGDTIRVETPPGPFRRLEPV